MCAIRNLALILICLVLASGTFAQVTPSFPGQDGLGMPPTPPTVPPSMVQPGMPMIPGFPQPAVPGLPPTTMPTSPGIAGDTGRPRIDIAEAAGTLTDPANFIYLSKEFVFNLLILANSLGIPGVSFDPGALPQLREVELSLTGSRGGRGGRASGEPEARFMGRSTESGRRTARAAQYMAGQDERNVRTIATPAEESGGQMLSAVTVTNNDELAKLVELVQDLPGWQRVGRFPLPTSEKQKIDKAIAKIYEQAFRSLTPTGQSPYGPQQPYTYSAERDDSGGQPPTSVQPVPGAAPGTVPGQPQQGPPPIDPQAMGEWYYYYQQAIGWERYVRDEILKLTSLPNNFYDLARTMGPQDLYMPPPIQTGQQSVVAIPVLTVHFDGKEEPVAIQAGGGQFPQLPDANRRILGAYGNLLSGFKPASVERSLDQIVRAMKDMAIENAKEDSERNRKFAVRLDVRQERRFRYRDWLNDQTTEIRKMAEDYRRRLAGEEFVIDGVQYLVSYPKPLDYVPLGSRNIVTERLTPYDLLDDDGTLKKATEETVEQPR